jgi:membrane-bound lytic murein transglycosylase B
MNATTIVADVLRAAADQIETYGWEQGQSYGEMASRHTPLEKCSACALGAIAANATTGAPRWEAQRVLGSLLPGRRTILGWNDDPDQTAENVIATLRAAADAAGVPA